MKMKRKRLFDYQSFRLDDILSDLDSRCGEALSDNAREMKL